MFTYFILDQIFTISDYSVVRLYEHHTLCLRKTHYGFQCTDHCFLNGLSSLIGDLLNCNYNNDKHHFQDIQTSPKSTNQNHYFSSTASESLFISFRNYAV